VRSDGAYVIGRIGLTSFLLLIGGTKRDPKFRYPVKRVMRDDAVNMQKRAAARDAPCSSLCLWNQASKVASS